MHKLGKQGMNIKKLCRGENNANHEEDHSGIHLTVFSFWICPGNVRWCTILVLGSMFETTSYPQSMAVSFRFSWSPLFCSATISSAQGQGVVLLMSKSTTKMTNTCLQWGDSGEIGMDESLSHPRRVLFTLQGR